MKPVITLHHVPHETLGTIRGALTDAGLGCRGVHLYDEVPGQPDLDGAAGLVVLGGPMNVDQTDRYPFLAVEVGWIRAAVDCGLPVLGVCLGSQLLAKALGAAVRPNGVKEIGWYSIELTDTADDDPLFGDGNGGDGGDGDAGNGSGVSGKSYTVFQWHGDTFEMPAGAVHLARSEACRHQAFRYGRGAYGLQFHIEVTAAMIGEWLDVPENAAEIERLDYIDPQQIRASIRAELPAMEAFGRRVFGRFAALCREHA